MVDDVSLIPEHLTNWWYYKAVCYNTTNCWDYKAVCYNTTNCWEYSLSSLNSSIIERYPSVFF